MSIVNDKSGGSNYRWYVLALAALTFTFVVAMPMMCMPVLFKEISEDLDLGLVQSGGGPLVEKDRKERRERLKATLVRLRDDEAESDELHQLAEATLSELKRVS